MNDEIKAEVTESSERGQPVPVDILEELKGKEPEHFVRLELDGKRGYGIYLTKDWQPTSRDKADLLKVEFDDGSVTFYTATWTTKSIGDDTNSGKP